LACHFQIATLEGKLYFPLQCTDISLKQNYSLEQWMLRGRGDDCSIDVVKNAWHVISRLPSPLSNASFTHFRIKSLLWSLAQQLSGDSLGPILQRLIPEPNIFSQVEATVALWMVWA